MSQTPNISAIRAREEKATKGPWRIAIFRRPGYCGRIDSEKPWTADGCTSLLSFEREEDAEFVIHAREDIPALLDMLEQRFTAPIVCMCGSTKFKQSWIWENARLTLEGNIVQSVALWGHHERVMPDAETKAKLDALYLKKIDLCDWVWVLDVGGYIGEGTRREIEYATAHGKPVRYLSQEFPDYVEPIDPVAQERDALREKLERVQMVAVALRRDRYDHSAELIEAALRGGERWKDFEMEVKR